MNDQFNIRDEVPESAWYKLWREISGFFYSIGIVFFYAVIVGAGLLFGAACMAKLIG